MSRMTNKNVGKKLYYLQKCRKMTRVTHNLINAQNYPAQRVYFKLIIDN